MLTRKSLYDLYRQSYGTLYRHSRNSANIISKLTRGLDKNSISYEFNKSDPDHLVIIYSNKFSIFVSGFTNRIDFIPYKKSGYPYNAKYEKSLMTPKGLVNYLLKQYGHRKSLTIGINKG